MTKFQEERFQSIKMSFDAKPKHRKTLIEPFNRLPEGSDSLIWTSDSYTKCDILLVTSDLLKKSDTVDELL